MITIIFIIIILFGIIYFSYFLYANVYYFKLEEFNKNRAIKPIESKPHLLDKPLYEFYINSSHNTYLDSIQHLSVVKRSTIKNILNLGARCIEIDISHFNNKPIVAHGTKDFITTSYLSLEKVLDEIINHGFNTSDPLIIFCEILNPDNKNLMINIKNLFIEKFKDKLARTSLKNLNYIADEPIKLFLNKVILLGTKDQFDILDEIFFPRYNFLNREDTDPKIKEINTSTQLSRIYKTEGIKSFLSFNINFKPIWKNNYKIVGMNYQMKDKLLYDYLNYFKDYSFIHQSEIKIE